MQLLTDPRATLDVILDLALRPQPRLRNESGRVIGGQHHRARLTDHDVWLICDLRSQGLTHAAIAEKFEVSIHTVKSIATGRRRAHIATAQR